MTEHGDGWPRLTPELVASLPEHEQLLIREHEEETIAVSKAQLAEICSDCHIRPQFAKTYRVLRRDLRDMLENVFTQMIVKKYGTADNFDVIVNIDKGDIEIYQEKTIVEEVEDPVLEIDLQAARQTDPDAEIGEDFVEVVDPEAFGRRLIVTAKQNFNQKIRDFEREHILEEYQNRIGEIIIGICFGVFLTLGAYYTQVQLFAWEPVVMSLPVALLVSAILYVNEAQDRKGREM